MANSDPEDRPDTNARVLYHLHLLFIFCHRDAFYTIRRHIGNYISYFCCRIGPTNNGENCVTCPAINSVNLI